MYSAKIFIVFVFTASITWQEAHCVDKTLEPGEHGAEVVRAVISKIVFSNITQFVDDSSQHNGLEPFMRTMAYVETRDGVLSNPQSGGIWNISNERFDYVKGELQSLTYQSMITELQSTDGDNHIRLSDWDSIVYHNLTIPLYSGLFARILILISSREIPIVDDFNFYWDNVFKSRNGDTEKWIRDARNLTLTEDQECTVDTDLVFVLDESGSIGTVNFQQVRNFVYNFSRELLTAEMSTNNSRVGVIVFSSQANEQIPLNSSLSNEAVLRQIAALPYGGGYTNTAAALELMRQQVWKDEISVLRLAIVITDGKSNINQSQTLLAAQAVHNHIPPIAVFAIGVGGNLDETELVAIASRPETYSHLDSFASSSLHSVGVSYSYQICFTESQYVNLSEEESGNLERGATTRIRLAGSRDGITFRLCIRSGSIIVYASTIPNPSSAQHGWRDEIVATAHSIRCSTQFYDLILEGNSGSPGNAGNDNNNSNGRRRRRQVAPNSATVPVYVTLEGQDDFNEFSFNSSIGNVTLDENECETDPCNYSNAECINTVGSFYCSCVEGYTGNGIFCMEIITPTVPDVNECEEEPCDSNETCINTDGSFYCVFSGKYYNNTETLTETVTVTHYSAVPVKDTNLIIVLTLLVVMIGVVTVVIVTSFTYVYKKQKTKNGTSFTNKECVKVGDECTIYENYGPCRLVPTLIKKYESMAANAHDGKIPNAPQSKTQVIIC